MDASARTLNMVAGREHLEVMKSLGVGDGWLGYIAGIIKLNLFAGHQAMQSIGKFDPLYSLSPLFGSNAKTILEGPGEFANCHPLYKCYVNIKFEGFPIN